MKFVEKNKKLFTKDKENNIINKNHNLLGEVFCEREGLFMDKTKNIEIRELIISKEDFKNYFNGRTTINKVEYQEYLNKK